MTNAVTTCLCRFLAPLSSTLAANVDTTLLRVPGAVPCIESEFQASLDLALAFGLHRNTVLDSMLIAKPAYAANFFAALCLTPRASAMVTT